MNLLGFTAQKVQISAKVKINVKSHLYFISLKLVFKQKTIVTETQTAGMVNYRVHRCDRIMVRFFKSKSDFLSAHNTEYSWWALFRVNICMHIHSKLILAMTCWVFLILLVHFIHFPELFQISSFRNLISCRCVSSIFFS